MYFFLSVREVDLLIDWDYNLIIWPKLCFQNAVHFVKWQYSECLSLGLMRVGFDDCLLPRLCGAGERWMNQPAALVEWHWRGRGRSTRTETPATATLSTTNPTLSGVGLNPDLRGERPPTNHLSHDTATLRRVRGTIVAVERQIALRILCVCL